MISIILVQWQINNSSSVYWGTGRQICEGNAFERIKSGLLVRWTLIMIKVNRSKKIKVNRSKKVSPLQGSQALQ